MKTSKTKNQEFIDKLKTINIGGSSKTPAPTTCQDCGKPMQFLGAFAVAIHRKQRGKDHAAEQSFTE